jgi:hypothetical protein
MLETIATSTSSSTSSSTLYDRDYVLWVEETVNQLRTRNLSSLDFENLIEEIEDLGKSEKRELENRLAVLCAHLLKRCYVDLPECDRGWELTIQEQRNRLQRLLKSSPSLRDRFAIVFDDIYTDALSEVRIEYPYSQFPDRWQFEKAVDAILTRTFWHQDKI